MATPRVTMASLHTELGAARVTLVTPNRRLAAFHRREYDRAQLRAGLVAWPSPDILPYSLFVERSWRLLALRAGVVAQPQLLDAVQSQLLWEQVIRKSESAHANPLMNIPQGAQQAASAWALAHAWHLLPAMRKFALHDDATMFMAWAQRYQLLCREKQAIDGAVVVDALAQTLASGGVDCKLLPARILAVGFDIVPPQQQHLWRMFVEAGIAVGSIEIARSHAQTHTVRMAFATETEELRACAAWARERLSQNAQNRIAIVVPDLQVRRAGVVRELIDALLPAARASTVRDQTRTASLFNFSLGPPLGDYGLVRDALALIAFSQWRAMPFLEVSGLLLSPFIAAADRERTARAMLDARLRETAMAEMSLAALLKQLANDAGLQRLAAATPQLIERLGRVAALADGVLVANAGAKSRSAAPTSPHDWSRYFGAVLTAWGFPGERPLDSIGFQVMAKLRDTLVSLAALASVQPRMSGGEALSQLRRIVADTPFQPESEGNGDAPIQVLGILESAGQAFDALWVTGLSDAAWPLPARANPLIPAALQRSAGVPEASAAASLELDERITAGWLASASEVVLSHVYLLEDGPTTPNDHGASALIRNIPLSSPAMLLKPGMPIRYAAALQALRTTEPIPDAAFRALPSPTAIRGGASAMRDQAACPFRAFARHRLGARPLEVPEPGLDAAARGTLLHHVLFLVWEKLGDHTSLMALCPADENNIVTTAARRAIAAAYAKGAGSLTGRFADIELARLTRVVGEWLAYERERSPFVVTEREALRNVELGGLAMALRLDRLDRLADGTYALIDYKTGEAKLSSWLGDRPDEPQLPLYCRTADQDVSALAFAKVRRGERGKTFGFEGVSAVEGLLPDVLPIEQRTQRSKHRYVSWDALTKEWDVSLAALAAGLVRGDAMVDPKYGGQTCSQCDLQSVCRVAEFTGYAAFDSDAAQPESDDA